MKMLMTGSLYQIPTFGFYRFWLVTKLRRHLWANTQIEGEPFEYTGTAKELLIGFLIALAVLGPIYSTYFIAVIAFEEQAAFASIPLLLFMYVLAHFGGYRARKYRASRTVFRGIRFWMKGSGWAYAVRAVLWDIATVLTAGLALPWAMASLERYRMRHTYFGSVQGDFAGTGWSLFKRGWWIWALGLVLFVGLTIVATALYMFDGSEAERADFGATWEFSLIAVQLSFLLALIAPVVLLAVLVLLSPLAMAVFTRWQIEGVRFGEVRLASRLPYSSFYVLFLKLIVSSAGFLLVLGAVAAACYVLFSDAFQEAFEAFRTEELSWSSVSIGVLVALAYLTALMGVGVLQRYFLGRGLWAAIVTTTTVTNLHSLDTAIAAGTPAGTVGEGLADALDFNVGV